MGFGTRRLAFSLLLAAISAASAHDLNKTSLGLEIVSTGRSAQENWKSEVDKLGLPSALKDNFFSIIRRDAVWTGRKITVCVGPPALVEPNRARIDRIRTVAAEWLVGTQSSLDWGDGDYRRCNQIASAAIRLNIAPAATGQVPVFTSVIGNSSINTFIKDYYPYSMLLQFPQADNFFDDEQVFRFYVLHEFGHALGFEHEHQRVDCEFDWNYAKTHLGFKTEQEAKDNLIKIFDSKASAYPNNKAVIDGKYIVTKYDNYSVMKYNLSSGASPAGDDPHFYKDGTKSKCFRNGWVSTLTQFDRAGVAKAYNDPAGVLLSLSKQLTIALTETANVRSLAPTIQSRLSDPALGRANLLAEAQLQIENREGLDDPDLRDQLKSLQSDPRAIRLLERVLESRSLESDRR